MTLKSKQISPLPPETLRVAQAAFPKGNAYLKLRDELDLSYADEAFQDLYPPVGQAAESPGRLALITVLQFAEGLSDRQAADAVRSRIDWKYLLGLELADSGFDFSVLSEFRGRLIAGQAEERLLDLLLVKFQAHGLIKERSRQRTDSTHIQAVVRRMNRLEKVGETLRAVLNDLAGVDPEWVRARLPLDWYRRYATRIEAYRLPKAEKEQAALAVQIGRDGYQVLQWVWEEGSPVVQEQPMVAVLGRVWLQEYYRQEEQVRWRGPAEGVPPSAVRLDSPYDPEARYSEKRGQGWVGYKAHLTETCEEDRPQMVVQVATTPAPQTDQEALPAIYADLDRKDLLPGEHLIDQGYMDVRQVVAVQTQYGIETLGIPMPDSSWQAKAGQGFALPQFEVDWAHQRVTCPMQQTSQSWFAGQDAQGVPVFRVRFAPQSCAVCPKRSLCTQRQSGGRTLTLRPQAEYETLLRLRQRLHSEEFLVKYRQRAGIEGTLSLAVRVEDLRHARYRGLAKVHLQHIATAAAMNLARVFAWISHAPRAQTRTSPLAALLPTAV
jgi:transposase